MSAFICARCDGFRDADDGCKEAPGFRLICAGCMSDEEEDADDAGRDGAVASPCERVANPPSHIRASGKDGFARASRRPV
jgi:hypothetical protein